MYRIYIKKKNYLMKEIKEDTHKWRDIPWPWTGRLITVKTSVLINLICRFNAIPIKNPASKKKKKGGGLA